MERNNKYKKNNFKSSSFKSNGPKVKRDRFLKEEKAYDNACAGRNPVLELLKISGKETIDKIFIERDSKDATLKKIKKIAKEKGILIKECDKLKLAEISGVKNHQGVVAIKSAVIYSTVEDILECAKQKGEAPFVIIVDGITDMHNVGAIIRTAAAAGAHGVIIPKHGNAGITGVVTKTSAGAVEHIKIARVTNLVDTIKSLKKQDFWVYAADMDGQSPYYKTNFNGNVALVIGGEDRGVSRLVKENCDVIVSIPMVGGVNSLNASVAASILMYEVLRNRLE